MTTTTIPTAPPRRQMNVWRLEWLRMTRSPRAITLGAVYLIFGLAGPILARYMEDIVKHAQSGVRIIVPPPTPRDGIANYVNQVCQIGLLVVVVIAAGALAFDARRGLATFLRTRAGSMWTLVGPRFSVNAAAAVLAYTLGTLAAWYETAVLLGSPPAGPMLAGLLCGSSYLVFAVAVVTAAASLARSTLGTVGIALAALLVLPILGSFAVLHDWLPSTLATAPVELLTTTRLSDYAAALIVTLGTSVVLVATAVRQLGRRET